MKALVPYVYLSLPLFVDSAASSKSYLVIVRYENITGVCSLIGHATRTLLTRGALWNGDYALVNMKEDVRATAGVQYTINAS